MGLKETDGNDRTHRHDNQRNKQLIATRYLGDEKGTQKIIAALRRLGYPWSEIKSAMSEELSDTEAQFDD